MTDSVTRLGLLLSLVFLTLITTWLTFSAGNSSFGNDVGLPRTGLNCRPDLVVKTTSTSATLVEDSLISRTIAPLFGTSMTSDGFLSVKSTPLLIKSGLAEISFGCVLTESV